MNSTLAIDLGPSLGSGIYDISNGSGMFRSQFTGFYSGSALAFPDAAHLYTYDIDTSGMEFFRWAVGSNGLTAIDASTLNGLAGSGRAFKPNGLIYGSNGGLVQGAGTHPQQVGIYELNSSNGPYSCDAVNNAPDPSLDRSFFLGQAFFTSYPTIVSFDQSRLVQLNALTLTLTNSAGPKCLPSSNTGFGLAACQPHDEIRGLPLIDWNEPKSADRSKNVIYHFGRDGPCLRNSALSVRNNPE